MVPIKKKIVVGALTIALLGAGCGRGGVASREDLAPIVEVQWLLAEVDKEGVATAIPPSLGARLELSAAGGIVLYDGVNATSGTYEASQGGFHVTGDPTYTLVGYAGSDPAVVAAVDAFDHIVDMPAGTITTSVSGTKLMLSMRKTTLTFSRIEPVERAGNRSSSASSPSTTG